MPSLPLPLLAMAAAAGILAGLALLIRGLRGYAEMMRFADTAPSRIGSLAIGDVQVSGVIEPVGVTLVSPLQSATCVFYRSSIQQSDDDSESTVFSEEESVGFRVRDATGSVRVFPRRARFDVPPRYDEQTPLLADAPPGLHLRTGSRYGAAVATREEQIRALLTVQPATPSGAGLTDTDGSGLPVRLGRTPDATARRGWSPATG